MEVIFERSGVNPFTMKIDLFDTFPQIKEKIQKHHGIPTSDQTLIFENTVLSDDFSILYSNIIDQSRIQLVVASDAARPAKKTKTAATEPPPTSANRPTIRKAENEQKIVPEAENRVKAGALRVVVVYEKRKIPVDLDFFS